MAIGCSHRLSAALILAAAIGAARCGSSATTSTATSPSSVTRCSVTVNGDGQVGAQGGTRSFTVSAARECAWSASVEGTWLSIRNGASGQGDGAVEVAAAANPDPQVRRGNVVLNEQRVEVMQAAAECAFTLSDPSGSFGQSGGSGAFEVRASSSLCAWAASSDSPWIAVRSGASGKGNAPVEFDVAAATGAPRTGTITAAGLRYSVTQAAGCSYTPAPLAHTVPSAGGGVTVSVATAADCPWTVSSRDAWITVAGPSSFSGPGAATFTAAAVAGAARVGSVVVAGQAVTISQGGACAFTVSPETAPLAAAGGSGRVEVSTAAGCAWTAASSVPWLQISGPASRTGPGEVIFQGSATTEARSGTMAIAGRTVTVNQGAPAAACAYSLSAPGAAVPAAGGTGSVGVSTTAGCAWSASSNAPWLTVTSGGSGTGSGTVGFSAAPHAGAARNGTLTIGGQTFSVTQAAAAAPCTYAISSEQLAADAAGTVASVAVTAGAGCAWSVSSQAPWISVRAQGAEAGNGTVQVTITENKGAARTGTATIAGRTLTVTQAAQPCAFKVSPPEIRVNRNGRFREVEVGAADGCAWTATSTLSWVHITRGSSGNGNGEVWLWIEENRGDDRTGTITVAGQTVTVSQRD